MYLPAYHIFVPLQLLNLSSNVSVAGSKSGGFFSQIPDSFFESSPGKNIAESFDVILPVSCLGFPELSAV